MDGEKMQVVIGYPGAGGTTTISPCSPTRPTSRAARITRMNINVTFAPNGAGHLVVTRDGITIVNYTGPLGDAGQTSVYWKEGIYRDASTTTEAVDYSNLSVTTGSPHANTSSNTQVFNTYDNTGSILSTTSNVFDANGNLVKSTVVSAGGGSQISTYAVTGQPYTSIVQNYSASGQLVGQIEYSSNGAKLYQMSSTAGVVSTWTYNATGAVVTSTVTDATGAETIYNYAAVGGALIEYQTYNAAKQLTENETFGAGQSKTIYMYQIAGQAYTSSVTQYNSSGQLVLLKQYNTNNTMHYESVIDSSGVTTNTSYDGNGLLMSSNVITPTVGNVVSTYNITGQPFVSSVAQYGVTGALVSLSEYNANNTLYYKSITAASGVVTNTRYDGNGHILNTNAINLDGSHVLTSYNAGSTSISCLQDYNSANAMTLNETFSSDGSYVIQHFGVTNQPYASRIQFITTAREPSRRTPNTKPTEINTTITRSTRMGARQETTTTRPASSWNRPPLQRAALPRTPPTKLK